MVKTHLPSDTIIVKFGEFGAPIDAAFWGYAAAPIDASFWAHAVVSIDAAFGNCEFG